MEYNCCIYSVIAHSHTRTEGTWSRSRSRSLSQYTVAQTL